MAKLLCERADWRSVIVVLITLLVLLVPFFLDLPLTLKFLWPLLVAFLSFSVCTINHNHVHCPTFYSSKLNFFFQLLLTVAKGHSSTTVIVPHNKNHHPYAGDEKDWIRPELAGDGIGLVRLIRYIFRASLNMARERRQESAPQLSERQRQELWWEKFCLALFILCVLLIDWRKSVVFIFLPWSLAMLFLVAVNLFQHDGCNQSSRYDHSRNFVSKLGNWFMFNNGYHTIHHLKPTLHWSKLPAYHATLVLPYMNSTLNESSLLWFIIRNYTLFQPRTIGSHITAQALE